MIPLHITGKAESGGLQLDTSHYYYLPKGMTIHVHEGARAVLLLLSDFTWDS
jgi:hypothetical protein